MEHRDGVELNGSVKEWRWGGDGARGGATKAEAEHGRQRTLVQLGVDMLWVRRC